MHAQIWGGLSGDAPGEDLQVLPSDCLSPPPVKKASVDIHFLARGLFGVARVRQDHRTFRKDVTGEESSEEQLGIE